MTMKYNRKIILENEQGVATQNNITMLTSLDTVKVLLDVLEEVTIGVSTIDA